MNLDRKDRMKHCVIIGSSRRLGAALVDEFLNEGYYQIIGVARTEPANIPDHNKWIASGRYSYFTVDIASSKGRESLMSIGSDLQEEPVCIILNAAHIKSDINKDKSLNYTVFEKTNRTNINGIGNVLEAFERHLLRYGGTIVVISSFWSISPPLFLPWASYPASKAYMDVFFKCLRIAWRKKVKVCIIHLGNIGGSGTNLISKWMTPTFQRAARKIVRSISRRRIPKSVGFPLWQALFCKLFLRNIPVIVSLWIYQLYFKIERLLKITKV